jgi:hypothetical protein
MGKFKRKKPSKKDNGIKLKKGEQQIIEPFRVNKNFADVHGGPMKNRPPKQNTNQHYPDFLDNYALNLGRSAPKLVKGKWNTVKDIGSKAIEGATAGYVASQMLPPTWKTSLMAGAAAIKGGESAINHLVDWFGGDKGSPINPNILIALGEQVVKQFNKDNEQKQLDIKFAERLGLEDARRLFVDQNNLVNGNLLFKQA